MSNYKREGLKTVPDSKEEIANMFFTLNKVAASLDYKWAYYNLAECYNEGFGVKQDFKKAFYWYKKAAPVLWYFNVSKMLGKYYLEGIGTEKNLDEAKKWLLRASEVAESNNKREIITKIKNFEFKTKIPAEIFGDWKSFEEIKQEDREEINSLLNLINEECKG